MRFLASFYFEYYQRHEFSVVHESKFFLFWLKQESQFNKSLSLRQNSNWRPCINPQCHEIRLMLWVWNNICSRAHLLLQTTRCPKTCSAGAHRASLAAWCMPAEQEFWWWVCHIRSRLYNIPNLFWPRFTSFCSTVPLSILSE